MARMWDGKVYLGDPRLRAALLQAMVEAERTGKVTRVPGYSSLKVSPSKDRNEDLE